MSETIKWVDRHRYIGAGYANTLVLDGKSDFACIHVIRDSRELLNTYKVSLDQMQQIDELARKEIGRQKNEREMGLNTGSDNNKGEGVSEAWLRDAMESQLSPPITPKPAQEGEPCGRMKSENKR